MDAIRNYERLREVEYQLDLTDPSENPPYRNARKRLNYERDQLREKLEGEDLLSSVDGFKPYQTHFRYLDRSQKHQFKMNKCIRSILRAIQVDQDRKWKSYCHSRGWFDH